MNNTNFAKDIKVFHKNNRGGSDFEEITCIHTTCLMNDLIKTTRVAPPPRIERIKAFLFSVFTLGICKYRIKYKSGGNWKYG